MIKADGLAAGKGVTVAETIEQANSAIHDALEGNVFGNAGSKVVIEDFLEGEEASILAMIDGENIVLLASSQDHKRIFEKDLGPNTGGMGAYSPASIVNKDVEKKVLDRVYKPLLKELKRRNISYKGILYAGLMIKDNDPYVVEFNCRFGDPETQAVLVRWSGDIIPSIIATINGTLSSDLINWHKQSSACVVMVSGGYPGEYKKGYEIQNIKQANDVIDTIVFQAGTKVDHNKIITDGGRVLGITSLGEDLEDALSKAYISVETISYENAFYRNDIGHHELRRKKKMGSKKPTVAIVMGSKTDWTTLEHTVKTLKEFNIESTVKVMSAHRTPHDATAFAENAAKNGYKVIIGAAGGAAHLCGVLAGHTTLRYWYSSNRLGIRWIRFTFIDCSDA